VNLRRDHWRKSTSVRGPRSGRRKRRSGRGSRKPEKNPKGRSSLRDLGGPPNSTVLPPELRTARGPPRGLRDEREKTTSYRDGRRRAGPPPATPHGGVGKPPPTTFGDRRVDGPGYSRENRRASAPPRTGAEVPEMPKKKRLLTMDTSGLPTTKDAARCDK
jgi:hypothetical protein